MLCAIGSRILRRMRTREAARAVLMGGVLFLLARAQVPPGLSPFALAFFAAGVVSGQSAGAMLLGCAAGVIRLRVAEIELMLPIGCAAMLAGVLLLDRLRARGKLSAEGLVRVLAVLGTLPAGLVHARGDPYRCAMAVCATGLAVAASGMFLSVLRIEPGRERWSRWERLSVAALFFAVLMGLTGFGGTLATSLAYGLAALATLGMAQDGPAAGALAGVVGGAALLVGGMHAVAAAALPAAGACAGLLRARGKLFAAPVFLLSGGLIGLYAPAYAPGPMPLAVAAILRIVLPDRWIDLLCARLNPDEREEASRCALEDARRRMEALAGAFAELGEAYRLPPDTPDEQALISDMRSALCTGCAGYSECWAGADNRAVRLLCQLISGAVNWDGAEPLFGEDMPPDVARVCRRAHMVPERLSGMLMDFSDVRRASVRRGEAYGRAARQFVNADRLIRDMAQPRARPRRARHTLKAAWGTSCLSMEAGQPSGDSHLVRFLSDGRLMVLLADGMGSGEDAARESARSVRLLWRLLSAEVDIALALDTVNEWMLTLGLEDMFVTVDLCLIDLTTGRAEFLKLAASRSVVLRGAEKHIVEGGRLPLGVLEGVRPSVRTVELLPGDVLLMGTDGVMDLSETGRVEDELSGCTTLSPAELAEHAVRISEELAGRRDDMTCVCVRISKNRRPGEGFPRPEAEKTTLRASA